jgi:hypothetical protein
MKMRKQIVIWLLFILTRFQPLLTKNDSIYLVVLARRFPLLEWSETGRISIKKNKACFLIGMAQQNVACWMTASNSAKLVFFQPSF